MPGARSKYKSDISEAIHSSAAMLQKVGPLDKMTMRDFDARHLAAPSMMEPSQIKQLREANNVSQPVIRPLPQYERKQRGEVVDGRRP
jgi:putative transcriptional regulator